MIASQTNKKPRKRYFLHIGISCLITGISIVLRRQKDRSNKTKVIARKLLPIQEERRQSRTDPQHNRAPKFRGRIKMHRNDRWMRQRPLVNTGKFEEEEICCTDYNAPTLFQNLQTVKRVLIKKRDTPQSITTLSV